MYLQSYMLLRLGLNKSSFSYISISVIPPYPNPPSRLLGKLDYQITNVPVFFHIALGRTVIILMGTNPLLGPLEGVGPENLDFFWPLWHSLRLHCHFRAQNSLNDFQRSPLTLGRVMDLPASHRNHNVPRHINNRLVHE